MQPTGPWLDMFIYVASPPMPRGPHVVPKHSLQQNPRGPQAPSS
jgi:hypothetical protein